MKDTSFPVTGGKCVNLRSCAERSKRWEQVQQDQLHKAEDELILFRECFTNGEANLSFSKHTETRQFQRSVSKKQIIEVILDGWPIERRVSGQEVTIVLLYHLRLSSTNYRPLHVVCAFNKISPCTWEVKTTYDPRTDTKKWDSGYQKRICFCK